MDSRNAEQVSICSISVHLRSLSTQSALKRNADATRGVGSGQVAADRTRERRARVPPEHLRV